MGPQPSLAHPKLDFPSGPLDNYAVARIEIEHLTKTFAGLRGDTIRALDDFNLTIGEGELLVLVGPSGCGKTTALRLIAGLEQPTAGSISIDGKSMKGIAPKERDIAMVFQIPALYPHMTVRENLAFGLRLRNCPRFEQEQRLREATEVLGLGECLDRRPGELSGGQCQRVALGRAIVRKPRVLLFDEPLSNLDPSMRGQLRLEIARLHKRIAATVLYVTHDQLEAMTLGERVAVMRQGRVVQVGRPMTLYRNPSTTFVGGFIGAPQMNLIRGTLGLESGVVWFHQSTTKNGHVPAGLRLPLESVPISKLQNYVGKEVILGLRPEHIWPARPESGEGRQTARLALGWVEPTGADTYFHVHCGGQTLVGRAQSSFQAPPGQELPVAFDLNGAHLFDPATGEAISCAS